MTSITFLLLPLFLLLTSHSSSRRILHQPFFPITDPPPPPPPSTTTQPPSSSPSPQPKYPFSSQPPPSPPPHHRFFPSSSSPATVPSTSLPTFPANISSITLPPPSSPSSSKSHLSKKLLFLSLTLSLLSIAFIAAVAASLLYHRNHNHKPPSSDSLRLFPPNLPTSDKPPPPPTLSDNFSTPSSEFLYLGTLVSPIHDQKQPNAAATSTMDSPELQPLPPLPRHGFRRHHNLDHDGSFTDDTDDNEFFSPTGFEDTQPQNSHERSSNSTTVKLPPPPPPPPPPPGLSETYFPAANEGRKEEGLKPKLKGLHWDKVRASSEKETVWDQLKSSSFR